MNRDNGNSNNVLKDKKEQESNLFKLDLVSFFVVMLCSRVFEVVKGDVFSLNDEIKSTIFTVHISFSLNLTPPPKRKYKDVVVGDSLTAETLTVNSSF